MRDRLIHVSVSTTITAPATSDARKAAEREYDMSFELKEKDIAGDESRAEWVFVSEDGTLEVTVNWSAKNPDKLLIYEKNTIGMYLEKLSVLDPLNTLKRGYTITKHEDKMIKSKKDLEIGDELEVKFDDGSVNAKVVDLNNEF